MQSTTANVTLAHPSSTGWKRWITTTNHKDIGLLYIITAGIFFLVGGTEAMLIRFQLSQPNNTSSFPRVI